MPWLWSWLLTKFTFPTIVFCSTLTIGPYLFYIEKFTTQFKTAENMIGHHSRIMSRLIIWPSMMLLGWTETKLWTLKYRSKSIQTSLILRQHPPKPYKLLKFFMISVILFKMGKHSDFHLSFFQTVGAWRDFTVVTKLMKNYKSLYGFGRCCVKIRDICMDFEPYFKVHNLVLVSGLVHPKSIILGQMINLDMIFHVVVSVYRLVKIWN